MDVIGSRFADAIGPHCVARDCEVPVLLCAPKLDLFDAEPHAEGNYRLSDQGGAQPYARLLTTAQQFGQQSKLHRRHDSYCLKAKRLKKR